MRLHRRSLLALAAAPAFAFAAEPALRLVVAYPPGGVSDEVARALAERGEPVGLKTLAAMIDEAEDTLEDVLEPHLIRCGLLARTARGRLATGKAHELLGLPARPRNGGELPFPS